MTDMQKETRVVKRGEGELKVEIQYTPRTGKAVRKYRLVLHVTSEDAAKASPKVFVFHRNAKAAPMEDGSPRDEFVCIADELDEDEIPVDAPDMERNVPYYRVADLELLFRNSDLMYETAAAILADLTRTRP